MNRGFVPLLFIFFFGTAFSQDAVPNQEFRKLIFADDFNRIESDEDTEELGGSWTTSSRVRAGGNKQVDLRDNSLHIFIHESADHAVSVRHPIELTDGIVELRFMLEHQRDALTLNFADLTCPTVHAGHLFDVTFTPTSVEIKDLKTGIMNLSYRNASDIDRAKLDLQNVVWSKSKRSPITLATKTWHFAVVTIMDDTIHVDVDGNFAVSFSSEGFAHPTKSLLRFLVPHQATIDDLKIYSLGSK